jgi:hypothetical protein
MNEWNLAPEQERAAVAVTEAELLLRRAQEEVRRAGEMLRRAIRVAETAEGELGDATRRLSRMESQMTEAGRAPG